MIYMYIDELQCDKNLKDLKARLPYTNSFKNNACV